MSSTMKRLFGSLFVLVSLFALIVPAAAAPAQQKKPRWEPDGPASRMLDPNLQQATGTVEIVVRLVDPPLAEAAGKDAKKGGKLRREQQAAYDRQLSRKQDALLGQIRALGGKEVARLTKALNAVIVAIDAAQLEAVAKLPGVRGLRQVQNYELALEETVPYVGAAAVQASGFDGTGVQVAVLELGRRLYAQKPRR